jgi:hypothetical protein
MNDDDKIFGWGVGMLATMFVLGAALQVCYRAQSRAMARTNADIVRTQQEIAQSQARFSALVRPEVLRGIVAEMYPSFESIGFKKNINAAEIPIAD